MRRTLVCIAIFLALEGGIIAGMVPRGTCIATAAVGGHTPSSASSDQQANIVIEGTCINEELIQPTLEEGNSFYLTHDRNGRTSATGSVFADYRCGGLNDHLLLYGHSFAYGTEMFTELKHAWQEDRFSTIGRVRLTVGGKTFMYRPIAALKVDASYAPIQQFAFADKEALRSWLNVIVNDANVRAEKSADTIARAQHVLSLVTCSDIRPGKSGRTIVVFASTDSERIPPLPHRS